MFTSFDKLFDFNGGGQLSTTEQAVEYMFLDDMSREDDDDEDESDDDEDDSDSDDNFGSDDDEDDEDEW